MVKQYVRKGNFENYDLKKLGKYKTKFQLVGEIPERCLYIAVKNELVSIRRSEGKFDLLSVGADKEVLYKRDSSTQYKRDDEHYLKHKDGVWLIYNCQKHPYYAALKQNDYYRLSSKGQLYKGEFMIQQ